MTRLLTTKQLADRLQVSLSTVYNWASSGAIPSISLTTGGNGSATRKPALRFDEAAINRWLKARERGTTTRRA